EDIKSKLTKTLGNASDIIRRINEGVISMSEKRKFLRFDTFLDGTFLAAYEKLKGLLMVIDASREGLKVAINRKLKEQTEIDMEIFFPGSIVPIFVTGQVIWLKSSANGWTYRYESGINITKIDAHDRQRILDYAYENWRKGKTGNFVQQN
ncbi:MAG: PilZ domain-containing protein, partial [Candidatus Omnitrophota bacterium]